MDVEVDMTEAKSDRFGLEFGGGEGGITGAVRAAKAGGAKRKGKGKTTTNAKGKVVQVSGPGDEWDLEDYGGGEEGEGDLLDVSVRVGLPVCVTLNLVSCDYGSLGWLLILWNRYLTASASSSMRQHQRNSHVHPDFTCSSAPALQQIALASLRLR
jgi:hypothetical protein